MLSSTKKNTVPVQNTITVHVGSYSILIDLIFDNLSKLLIRHQQAAVDASPKSHAASLGVTRIGPNRPKIAQNRSMRPRNVHFSLTKMAIANQTQLTPLCFEYDRTALSAPSLVGESSVTLRDLPHTIFNEILCVGLPAS